MLNIDPIAVSQAYGRAVDSQASTRSLELKPIYNGGRSGGYAGQDSVDISKDGQDFSSFLSDQNKKQQQAELQDLIRLTPQQQQISQRYDQARAQVIGFLIAQGLTPGQALPQAEKIISRMGYQRHPGYGQSNGGNAESFESELKKTAAREETAAIRAIDPISGVNILA